MKHNSKTLGIEVCILFPVIVPASQSLDNSTSCIISNIGPQFIDTSSPAA